jgi:hypothetical protein
MGKRVNYSNLRYLLKTVRRLVWRIIFFKLREVINHLLLPDLSHSWYPTDLFDARVNSIRRRHHRLILWNTGISPGIVYGMYLETQMNVKELPISYWV